MRVPIVVIAASIVLAGASGFFVSQALSQGEPTKTVTIDLKDGEAGPAGPEGPQGPKGEPGAVICPEGYVYGKLVVNHPGGQTTLLSCMTPDSN